ncbi:hypothetical protein [Pseudomonas extremaustralis]|uniref:hypothetical protein n=1 Tax=Pseudomonas extremaustralis TaxID=359110 RepID=UPI00230751F6|nr:hypothetical protein [Pseudomonas extremaustralis]MDB1108116.1 hypothetical protein [Pseudomonas extremaustralis]
MSIQTKTVTAYYAPVKGKTYLTKMGAIHAETRAIIMKKYPIERGCISCDCGDTGYHIEYDEPARYGKMYRRLRRAVARSIT